MKERTLRGTRNLQLPALFCALAVFLLLPLFAGAQSTAGTGEDAKPAVKGEAGSPFDSIKKTYAGITSLEASFHQKIFVSGIKKIRDFDGDFYFKRQKGSSGSTRNRKPRPFSTTGITCGRTRRTRPSCSRAR
jgi:hypothetical protein